VDQLGLISKAARLRERRRRAYDDADAELRDRIREGFDQGYSGEKIAKAAGVSVPRVYQIRDGRR
jgi:DNA-binding transcriptional MerR regulator